MTADYGIYTLRSSYVVGTCQTTFLVSIFSIFYPIGHSNQTIAAFFSIVKHIQMFAQITSRKKTKY